MKILFRVLVLFFGITGVGTDVSFAQSGWFWQNPLPQGNTLNAVAVLDPQNAIAVGNSGTILRTTDSGATWTRQPSGTTNLLHLAWPPASLSEQGHAPFSQCNRPLHPSIRAERG